MERNITRKEVFSGAVNCLKISVYNHLQLLVGTDVSACTLALGSDGNFGLVQITNWLDENSWMLFWELLAFVHHGMARSILQLPSSNVLSSMSDI